MKTLVIGLGNPVLRDDGAGIYAARLVSAALPSNSSVEVIEASVGGIALMENMVGYESVILIDSLWADESQAGQVLTFDAGYLPQTLNTASTHDADLPTALAVGRLLGASLPRDEYIQIVAITAHDVLDFGEMPSARVAAAIPEAAARVLALLGIAETRLDRSETQAIWRL